MGGQVAMLRRSTVARAEVALVLIVILMSALALTRIPEWTESGYYLGGGLVVLIASAFTRADRLRLSAAVLVLSMVAAFLWGGIGAPSLRILMWTVELRQHKAQVGAAIADFVQRHGRPPTSCIELYPDGITPDRVYNEPRSLSRMKMNLEEKMWGIAAEYYPYPEAVVLKDPRWNSISGPIWRYDIATGDWVTDSALKPSLWRVALLEQLTPRSSVPALLVAMFTVALTYRPWRRLGEQQRASIKPEET